MKLLLYVTGGVMILHGLVHVMGFVAYWPLATLAEVPYKTTLAGGLWNVGASGMKVFAILWLLAALSFLAAVGGLAAYQGWWRQVMMIALLLSTVIISLDWAAAFRGAFVNGLILLLIQWASRLPGTDALP